MYYIVFALDFKKNVVVPKQWIKNIKEHKEKFYNNSINCGQIFTCYYTNHQDAFDADGLPNGQFKPNFEAPVSQSLDGEGLLRIKLKAYKGTREGATEYLTAHRNNIPGMYNKKRLREMPIPEGNSDSSSDSEDENPVVQEIIIPSNANTGENIECHDAGNKSGTTGDVIDNASASSTPATASTGVLVDEIMDENGECHDAIDKSGTIGDGIETTSASSAPATASTGVLVDETWSEDNGGGGPNDNAGTSTSGTMEVEVASVSVSRVPAAETSFSGDCNDNLPAMTACTHNDTLEDNGDDNGFVPVPRAISPKREAIQVFPIFEVTDNDDDIMDELDEHIVETLTFEGDCMEVTYKATKGFGKPLRATSDGRVKLEISDAVSGMIPFITTKKGRAYLIGDAYYEIQGAIFSRYAQFNEPPYNEDVSLDKRLVCSLLMATTEKEQLIANDISPRVLDFVREILQIRCRGQMNEEQRIAAIAEYVKELCAQKRKGNQ